jgi:prepilin-type N-terminal cleavage/methylation domain-containing protein
MRNRRAFTLLELLIVIGIIALLISILFPVLAGVRAQGHAVLCQNNERALWQGIVAFATDNDGHVVGSQFDVLPTEANPLHQCWLRGPNGPPNGWMTAPQAGTLWKYIRNTSVYLCPAREHDSGVIGTTQGFDLSSNGHFDYTIFLSFAGAKLEHMPAQATVTDPSSGATVMIPTPYLVEEQPIGVNKSNMEGGHATSDHLAHIHFGGSYYMAPDGSCQFYIEPAAVSAQNYTARTARSSAVSLGLNNHWGWWEGL